MVWTSPATQHAVILGRVAGTPLKHLAATYGLSVSTVERIVRKAKETKAIDALPGSTSPNLERLKASLLVQSHVAIDLSVKDRDEPHKAASTGLQYLRGVGEHGSGERAADVQVNVLVANTPAGFEEMLAKHRDVQAIDSKGTRESQAGEPGAHPPGGSASTLAPQGGKLLISKD
jgi:DNA-binding Lrp family transcriptional regulator